MKLLVCDVEGTIFKAKYRIKGTEYASTMWQPLAQRLGEAAIAAEIETHRKWENNEYSNYIEWVEDTVEIHKHHKLHKDTFNSLINEAEYIDGVVDFFNELDRSKYVPVLVSGGFQELVRRAQKELNIKYGYGACEYEFDIDTGYLSSHTMTPCDFEGKYQYVNALFAIYNLNPNKDWVFIGDGKNDIHIANKAPISYGINPHPELAKIVDFKTACFKEFYTQLIAGEDIYITDENDLVQEEEFSGIEVKDNEWETTLIELTNAKAALVAKEEEAAAEIDCLNELLIITSAENKDKEVEVMELRKKCSLLQNEILELQRKKDAAEKRVEKEVKTRRKEIEDLWALNFRHFSFTKTFFHEAAKLLHGDWLRLHEKLMELHEAPDPRTLSRSKYHDSGLDHFGLTLLGGVAARVDFRLVHGHPHKIDIVEFYKKNEM